MKLIENKRDILQDKIDHVIYWKRMYIGKTNMVIWRKQSIWIDELITSDYLIRDKYNEINR